MQTIDQEMSSPPSDLVRVEDLSVHFQRMGDRIDALRGLSLTIRRGRVTALVGESGSGKSVLGQTIIGIQPHTARVSGRVMFFDPASGGEGENLLGLPRDGRRIRAVRGNRIGMIFQEPMTSFSPLHTVGDQISEALTIHAPVGRKEAREATEDMLGMVGFRKPKRIFDLYPFELSGGMRQRAMIAMALICRPALLIADEPTTALDVTIQAQILKLLADLKAQLHMAILLITHDLGVVANLADDVVVIYRGEIMESGSVDAIFRDPRHPYLRGLMAAVPHFDMAPGERLKPLRETAVDGARLLGKAAATPASRPAAGEPEVLVAVRDISKTFSTRKSGWFRKAEGAGTRAVDRVSFDIRRGESLGLVGESGSGKTTLSKILMRGVRPDSGSITFSDAGGPIDLLAADGAALDTLRGKIQMVFQDPVSSLSPRMTVRNILTEPLDIHRRGDRASRLETALALIRAVGLGERALERYPHSFSGGQRQRIGIARALALGPELLICDEPVSALDVSVQAEVLNLLKDLQSQLGLTYLFISHNLAVVNYIADRVAVMCDGRIVELAPCERLMKEPVHPYTKLLLASVPTPDLDRPLDYRCIDLGGKGRRDWGAAFLPGDTGDLAPIDLGGGHIVLARSTIDAGELRP